MNKQTREDLHTGGQAGAVCTLDGVRPLWREFDVRRAWLFGGRARGEADAGSDWDFLVEFAERPGFSNFMGLKCALEDALGAKVDLLSLSAFGEACCDPRTQGPRRRHEAAKRAFLARIEKELVDVY